MTQWFEGSIRYEKMMENGMLKKVTEKYLIDAVSCTEAEARLIQEMTPFISGEFRTVSVKETNYLEIFISEETVSDMWFKCKLSFIIMDEKSGKEKKTSTQVLVQASDFVDAVKRLNDGMKGMMTDYIIDSIADSKIIDVYFYNDK